MPRNEHIVIRSAASEDESAVATLAVLDGGMERLEGTVIVAETGGRIRAAYGTGNDAAISDPFYPSADLVRMLRVHGSAMVDEHERVSVSRLSGLRRSVMA
jgi:hypothetical protein